MQVHDDTPDQDDLEDRYQTFLSHNVKQPASPLPPGDPSPDRPAVTLSDIHRPDGPDARETSGALLAPQYRHRHGPDVASPAPHVSTTPPEAFPYHAAGTNEIVIPGPVKAGDGS